jgi:hypothetical protein
MIYILHQTNILKYKGRNYKLKVSFLQIHNDRIYNLTDSTTGELKICEDESGRNFVKDLKVTFLKFIVIVFLALYVHFIFVSPFINQEIKAKIERQRSVDVRTRTCSAVSRTKKRWVSNLGLRSGCKNMRGGEGWFATLQHKFL